MGVDRSKLCCGIQNGIGIDSRNRAAHHVSRDVTAGSAAGNTNRFQPPKNLGKLLDPQPVKLNGLASGDIAKAMSELIGQSGDFSQLSGIHLTARYPHPEHEVTVLFRFLLINSVPFKPHKVI